jgi:hypothetical protein
MLRQEISELKTDPATLRKFGLVVGAVFAGLGAWFWWRHRPIYPWFLVPATPLLVLGAFAPTLLKEVYRVWMTLALVMGLVMSTVILTLFYYLVVTPIGLAARVAGKDFLSRRLAPDANTYWIKRDRTKAKSKADYEQQF